MSIAHPPAVTTIGVSTEPMELKMDLHLEARLYILESVIRAIIATSPNQTRQRIMRVLQDLNADPERIVVPSGLLHEQQQAFREMIRARIWTYLTDI
jgi:hypothetical protein